MRLRRVIAGLAAGGALITAAPAAAQTYEHRPTASDTGRGGAAATVDSVATRAAIAALRDGGNAVDATVTAAAVLGVTEPFSCGIGGGGYMLIRTRGGDVTSIDHRERSPRAMQPNSFLTPSGTALSFSEARYSGLSAGVPGTVEGWRRALARYGTIELEDALAPAVDVARRGFRIDQTFFDQVQGNRDYFDDIPSSAALYLDPDRTPRDVGTVQRNPDLAKTYRRIGREGADGFYEGPVARAMVAAARRPPVAPDANHVWRPGLMDLEDLEEYGSRRRTPTRVSYRGYDVYGMGPSSSGGQAVGEALNVLEGFKLTREQRVQALHLFLEASRVAFADRNAYLADPAFFDVPLRGLLSDEFAAQRRALIDPTRALAGAVPAGNPAPFNGRGEASATVSRTGSTTHISVADRRGTVVSYTFTIESTGGNGIVVPGWGFLLNNELTDFNYESTSHPNRPEGRKRPRSSMSPTIVTRDDEPVLAIGSPGGSTIITTVLQILLERFDLGASLPEAIARPRATQRNGATTAAEPQFIGSPEGRALQAQFGHRYTELLDIGAAAGVEILPRGRFRAAAEPRRRGGGSGLVVR